MYSGKRKGIRALVLAAPVILVSSVPVLASGDAVCSKGVFISAVNVSGMTREEAKAAVDQYVEKAGEQTVTVTVGDNTLTPTLNDLGLTWNSSGVLDEAMQLGATGSIVQRYKDQKDLQNSSKVLSIDYQLDEKTLDAYVKNCESYNTDPVNATVYTTDELLPGIEGGTDGITLNVEGGEKALRSAVDDWDGVSALSVELPVDRVKPDVSADDLYFGDVLGTATTDFSASSSGRWQNVVNGCSKISGTLIYPGESFSVTQAVTPFTAENGYALAPSYEENQVVESYGGGICQVSTTLYNAVLKAELEVTARSNHTLVVSYVDLSKDAAIAEGIMDMAFVNSLENPIYIIGYTTSDGLINFTIYGKEYRPANRTIEFVSKTISQTDPSDISKLAADPEQQIGYISQTGSPHTGYTAELWKNIYTDGQLTDSVQINSSTYNAVGTIYDIGVASQSTAWTQAMYNAIAQNSLDAVYSVINNGTSYLTSESESETTASTEAAPDTNASSGAGTDQPETSVTAQTDASGSGDTDEVVVTYDQYGNAIG